jgi:hypothetical protein
MDRTTLTGATRARHQCNPAALIVPPTTDYASNTTVMDPRRLARSPQVIYTHCSWVIGVGGIFGLVDYVY